MPDLYLRVRLRLKVNLEGMRTAYEALAHGCKYKVSDLQLQEQSVSCYGRIKSAEHVC